MLEAMATLITTGTSLIGLAKGATDAAHGLKALVEKPDVDATAAKNLISDLLDRLIRLQAEQIAMQGTILELREEQHRVDKFQAEAVRYVLTRTEQNSLVYELDPAKANGEPAHCICAACYEKQIKSILQPVARNTLTCGRCGGTFYKPDGQGSGIMIGRVRRPDFDGFI